MRILRSGDDYVFVMNIRGMEVRDLLVYERHRLAGTPYYIEHAMMLVVSMVTSVINKRNGVPTHDEDDPDAVMEADVMAYLSEGEDYDFNEDDDSFSGPSQEHIDQVMGQTQTRVNELYDLLAEDIFDVLENEIDVRDRLTVEDIGFRGRRGLIIRLGVE